PFAAMAQASAAGTSLSSVDQKFAMTAAMGGMAEVTLGKYAQNAAASGDVKQFGAHMVTDHTAAGDELAGIAKSKGLKLPEHLDAAHQKAVDKVEHAQGAGFDRAFMAQMLADHHAAIAAFKKEASSGKDADLKAFAQKTLPTLESHLKMAEGTSKVAAK